LCSGTTTGTRAAMLEYLALMYEEMKAWIQDSKCRFPINGDDQSIHNYLFYTGKLPFAKAMVHRKGGIVNMVGVEGANQAKRHRQEMKDVYGLEQGPGMWKPFRGAHGMRWMGQEFDVCDDQGYFTELDGSISRVIHQWDRFGRPFVDLWLNHNDYFKDPVPGTPGYDNLKLTLPMQVTKADERVVSKVEDDRALLNNKNSPRTKRKQ